MLETVVKNKSVQFIHLGEVDYKEGWDYQEKLFWESVDTKVANRKRSENEQEPTFNYLILSVLVFLLQQNLSCNPPRRINVGESSSLFQQNFLLAVYRNKHHFDMQ